MKHTVLKSAVFRRPKFWSKIDVFGHKFCEYFGTLSSHREQGSDPDFPWERIERSDFSKLEAETPDRIIPFVVDIRDISTTLKWDPVDGALEYLLVYEPGNDTHRIESPYFAGSDIIHLHNTVSEMTVRPLEPSQS